MRYYYSANYYAAAPAAPTTRTMLQLDAVTKTAFLVEFSVSFNGTNPAYAPWLVEGVWQSSAGAGSTSPYEAALDTLSPARLASPIANPTTEPTWVSTAYEWYVSPYSGLLLIQWEPGRGPVIDPAGNRFGFRFTSPAGASTPTWAAYIIWGE